jgi:hypothetical protein
MKKYLHHLLLIAFCMSCNIKDTQVQVSSYSTAIAVVTDVTDKKKLWPEANSLLELYHYKLYPNAEGWFDLSVISDKVINVSYSYHLPDAQITDQQNSEDDPQFRAEAIAGFYTNVKNAFTDLYRQFDTTKAYPYSQCWATISFALIKLNQNSAAHKYLFAFTDGSENSALWNAYRADASINTQTIAARFLKAYPIPQNLNGITVIFVYLPASITDDKRYTKMVQLYKFILEQRGATVVLQTNNSNYDL